MHFCVGWGNLILKENIIAAIVAELRIGDGWRTIVQIDAVGGAVADGVAGQGR